MIERLGSLSADCPEFSLRDLKAPQSRDVPGESHTGDVSGPCGQALATPCAGTGIMIFSSTCKTVYANQAACEFLKVLNRWEHGHATDGALPRAIAGLYDRMEVLLARRIMKGDGQKLEARRLITGEGRTVRLNAFGLRDRPGMGESRVVITMHSPAHPFVRHESGETIPASI